MGLLGAAAESVRIAAVANSRMLRLFCILRSSTRGGMAPALTIVTLFLSLRTARLRRARREDSRASRLEEESMKTRG
uniref:Uncharacterized protein n=1 Tax=Lotus japonicus TaxID=34305 RepID=I3S287_LOTJA|nr:unknown [Lotus japonicus]